MANTPPRSRAERGELGFPPALRVATLTATAQACEQLLESLMLPASAELLGPVPLPDNRSPAHPLAAVGDPHGEPALGQVRYLVRVPRADGALLARALHAGQALRSAAKASEYVRVQVDPIDIG